MARPRPEDLRTTPVPRGRARGAAPPMQRPATGGATTARGGTLADVQRIMDNSPPKIREAIAEILDRDGVAAAITFIKNMGSARRASPAAQRPTQVARRRPPTIPTGPARTGPARMMKGGMYKGKTHSYVAGGKVTEGKY
jgi:hypothetical protein